jgi:predicted kinase
VELDTFFRDDHNRLDFEALQDAFDWVRAMATTPQDPHYHAEGDVWTHTRMVCDALTGDAAWPGLDAAGRRLMLTAALMHDMAKPEVTFTDPNGRIRSPQHAVRGAVQARRLLWRMEEPLAFREAVAALVRNHMQPRYLPERSDPRRRLFALSQATRCDLLAMLARADARGRVWSGPNTAIPHIERFMDLCRRHDCVATPREFASDHARFLYFQGRLDDPDADVADPAGPVMTVMSGLPGSGKDTWVTRHRDGRPVISLDAIRLEIGVGPTDSQEPVVRLAHERVVRMLEDGTDFIWNATTLGRRHRQTLLDLASAWDPYVRMVHVDAPPSLLFSRNNGRAPHAVVPQDVIWRMTNIWHPPDRTEAHDIVNVLHDGATSSRPTAPRP